MLALWTQVTFWRISSGQVSLEWTDLSVVLDGKVECESSNSLSLGPGGNLQALYDTWERLVLETRVFSFSVFSDNGEIDVFVSGWETWEGFADDDGSVDIEGLTHSDVP
jgi:hypothetical protein